MLLNQIAPFAQPLVALDSSANNIPTSFNSSAGSAIVTSGDPNHEHFAAVNYSSTPIAVSLDGGNTSHFIVPASNTSGPGVIFIETVRVGTAVSIKSLGSAITSGLFYLMVW